MGSGITSLEIGPDAKRPDQEHKAEISIPKDYNILKTSFLHDLFIYLRPKYPILYKFWTQINFYPDPK